MTLHDSLLRPARWDEIDALVALVQRAYRGPDAKAGWTHEADLLGGQRIDATMLAAMLADPAQAVLVAEDGQGALAGCVALAQRDDGAVYLGMLTVDPGLQARGLGRRLLAAGEDFARDRFAATRLEMTVIVQRAELIAWYERRGWRRTGERRAFPYGDARYGEPQRGDLEFLVLAKPV